MKRSEIRCPNCEHEVRLDSEHLTFRGWLRRLILQRNTKYDKHALFDCSYCHMQHSRWVHGDWLSEVYTIQERVWATQYDCTTMQGEPAN